MGPKMLEKQLMLAQLGNFKYKRIHRTLQVIKKRKSLLTNHPNQKREILATTLSKEIRENIRKDRNNKRRQSQKKTYIKLTGVGKERRH